MVALTTFAQQCTTRTAVGTLIGHAYHRIHRNGKIGPQRHPGDVNAQRSKKIGAPHLGSHHGQMSSSRESHDANTVSADGIVGSMATHPQKRHLGILNLIRMLVAAKDSSGVGNELERPLHPVSKHESGNTIGVEPSCHGSSFGVVVEPAVTSARAHYHRDLVSASCHRKCLESNLVRADACPIPDMDKATGSIDCYQSAHHQQYRYNYPIHSGLVC